MTFHYLIHPAIQLLQFQRIFAHQARTQFLNAYPDAFGIGWKVNGTKRTNFPKTGNSLIGLNPHYGGIEGRYRFTARPLVISLVKWQIDLPNLDFGNLHA